MSYVPSTTAQREEMLRAVGVRNYRELYRDVPQDMLLDRPLDIPEGMSELEVTRALSAMAAKNRLFPTVLRGAGSYDHYIPALVKFAELKRPRLDGLVAHAVFPISTGKLEGFNNKIKVAKRIGYGYRDDEYFFTLIRYLALPVAWLESHNFP